MTHDLDYDSSYLYGTVEQSILGKMDDVGYKYTASYANIVKESLNGTVPEVFDRMNGYESEYGVELE